MRKTGNRAGLGKPKRFSTQLRPGVEDLLREMSDGYGVPLSQIIEDAILLFAGEFYYDSPPGVEFGAPGCGIVFALDRLDVREEVDDGPVDSVL